MRPFISLAAVVGLSISYLVQADDGFGPIAIAPAAQLITLGALHLVALRDAQFVVPNDAKTFGVDVGSAAVGELLKVNGLPDDRITLGLNVLLVRTGPRVILLDAGIGPKANGGLMASLKEAGVSPDEVTDVMITHTHGDHVGGLLDTGGQLAFPKAIIRMATPEWAWMKSQKSNADLVKAIQSRVQTFTPGKSIAPGVTPVALDGHTPGHVGYEIVSGTHRLLDIGDLAHSSVLSLKKPEWTMGFDNDSALAKATRKTRLARLAKNQELVFAPHFPFPGIGHIAADHGAFTWMPGTP